MPTSRGDCLSAAGTDTEKGVDGSRKGDIMVGLVGVNATTAHCSELFNKMVR